MADASRPFSSSGSLPPKVQPPQDWRDAFAAMPLQSPTVSAWPQLAAHLDQAVSPQRSKMFRFAIAASLCAIALTSLSLLLTNKALRSASDSTQPIATAARDYSNRPSAVRAPEAHASASRVTAATTMQNVHSSRITASQDRMARTQYAAHAEHRHPSQRSATAHRSMRIIEGRARRQAKTSIATGLRAKQVPATQDLQKLYNASAQLETLLGYARDLRMQTGPAAALSSALDAQLASIDARLAQPGLGSGEQFTLWQARVETLEQAAAFESKQRVLAARGERYDGALVNVD